MIAELYADGGVIASNPSMIGGTYAWRLVYADGREIGQAKAISMTVMGLPVTNNQTELLALLAGMTRLPADFAGTIYSDSQVTLGRVFMGWKWGHVPGWMHRIYQTQRSKFTRWHEIKYVLLDGHPTKAQLRAGIGKRGHPVSIHNVWCDEACRQAAEDFMAAIGQNIPTSEMAVMA